MIVGNLVSGTAGFDADDNEVLLVPRSGDSIAVAAHPSEPSPRIFDEALKLRLTLHAAHER